MADNFAKGSTVCLSIGAHANPMLVLAHVRGTYTCVWIDEEDGLMQADYSGANLEAWPRPAPPAKRVFPQRGVKVYGPADAMLMYDRFKADIVS